MTSPFLAVDWGTTNRRVFRIERGQVLAKEQSSRGATAVTDFPAEVAGMRERLGELPMLLAGMVGSTIGWRTVPYVRVPAGLSEIAAALAWVDQRTAIVPGVELREHNRADVMRGEEMQLLGAWAASLVPDDGVLCQPGTHSKWAWLEQGKIVRFVSAMSGELFGLLREHSLLANQLAGDVADGAAFREGVKEGARGDLAASLFGIRASALRGLRSDADAAAYASGLLIGADVGNRLAECNGALIHIVGDGAMVALYAAAIEELGGSSNTLDGEAAFVAGISQIRELIV